MIEEYINDELIDQRPNPIGEIPVAFCPNIAVSRSPWGLADIADIMPLNREYNEKATEISDIINYHVAPVTVITGAKASNLEKGPTKVWAIGNKDAKVQNLELATNFPGRWATWTVQQAMHELTGVPATALGTMQPISNTSGVALQVQYQPLMLKHDSKKIQYTPLFQQINELVMRHAFRVRPVGSSVQPWRVGHAREGRGDRLDPSNPVIYRTSVDWPSPMPMDILIKINEIQAKMAMSLESKRGALRDLGEEFPDQKMGEIFEEVMEDTKEQGALDMARAQIQAVIFGLTGMLSGPEGVEPGPPAVTSAGGSDVSSTGAGAGQAGAAPLPGPMVQGEQAQDMVNKLTTKAFGGRFAQWRNPSNTDTS